jgi:mono/diheme cytochrome c family protein
MMEHETSNDGKGGGKGKLGRVVRFLLAAAVILGVPLGIFAWYKFFRDVPQPAAITSDPREYFLYGSIGGENQRGIPYWILVVLPRIFPEYLPGPGGYASLGLPWEEGKEFPAGFSKKTIGFERVGFNCALCHATQYRVAAEAKPVVVAAGGSNTADIQGLLEFSTRAANDPRFNATTILTEIDALYPLSWIDRFLYRFAFVPIARKRLAREGREFEWAKSRPRWGPGRDAPMNLTKFNFLGLSPDDGSVDSTDFPSIWHLSVREQEGRTYEEGKPITPETMLMNLDGATTSFRSVIIDSALGLGGENTPFFNRRMADLEAWLRDLPPPAYPLPIDGELAARGEPVFEAQCGECHAGNRRNRLGTVIPIAEIGTDRERLDTWTKAAADAANEAVAALGIRRSPMIKTEGYAALQLDGLWLRGPYLHNGSVPTVRDLLEPAARRPRVFCRGYDVLDRGNLGFLSDARVHPRCAEEGPPAEPSPWDRPPTAAGYSEEWPRPGVWKYYVSERGNGNGGHEYGTALSPEEKAALIEYLKTR